MAASARSIRALVARGDGSGAVSVVQRDMPRAARDEVLIHVAAAGINRADLLQAQGKYPVPPGVTDILGLECAGTVAEVGADVRRVKRGDRVMALVRGGACATHACAYGATVCHVPPHISFAEAAAIPEAYLTAYKLLQRVARVARGEHVLVHAGASSVGQAAIQLSLQCFGAGEVSVTAGSDDKLALCGRLGASTLLHRHRQPDFGERLSGKVDVLLDCVGGSYFEDNLKAMARDGRWVVYGLLGGDRLKDGASIGALLSKRLSIIGTTLRSRSPEYQAALVQDFEREVLPLLEDGRMKTMVDREFALDDAQKAYEFVASSGNTGKVVLRMADG